MLKVECPTGECAEPWSDSTIESLITPEEFKRYTKLKEIAIVNADPTLRWCIRPGCERYNKGSAENPHIICACGTEICFHCSLRWHPKKTCEQVKSCSKLLLNFNVLLISRQWKQNISIM